MKNSRSQDCGHCCQKLSYKITYKFFFLSCVLLCPERREYHRAQVGIENDGGECALLILVYKKILAIFRCWLIYGIYCSAKLLICYWKTVNKFLMLYDDTNVSNVPIKYIKINDPISGPNLYLLVQCTIKINSFKILYSSLT